MCSNYGSKMVETFCLWEFCPQTPCYDNFTSKRGNLNLFQREKMHKKKQQKNPACRGWNTLYTQRCIIMVINCRDVSWLDLTSIQVLSDSKLCYEFTVVDRALDDCWEKHFMKSEFLSHAMRYLQVLNICRIFTFYKILHLFQRLNI